MSLELTAEDTATTAPTQPELPPDALRPLGFGTLLAMAVACGTGAANIYYNQPLLRMFQESFHTDPDHAGLVATAAQVGYGVGIAFFVPLGDLLERRRVVLVLVYCCTALLAGMALSPNLWTLIVAQLLVGITAMSAQLLIPLAVDLSPPHLRGKTVGTLMAGLLCGLLLARTLGGLVGDHFGWPAMFFLASGIMLGTGIMLQLCLPHRPPTLKMSYPRLMGTLWDLWRELPALRTASIITGTSFGAFCAFWAVLSFYLHDKFDRGATEAGLFGIVGLIGAVFAPLAGRLSDKRGPAFTLTIALAISVLSFGQMWVWSSIAGLIVGVLVLDLGVQSTQVAAQSEVMALRPDARSRLNTIYMIGRFAGGAAGSAIGTAAYVRGGWPATCAVCIVALLVGLIVHFYGSCRPPSPGVRAEDDRGFYVDFEIADAAAFERLQRVFDALRAAKTADDWKDDPYWLAFFDAAARTHFWWPTEAELTEHYRRWTATPVERRLDDPTLRTPWTLDSMIDAFRNGDYALLGCRRTDEVRGRLTFDPFAGPYGGTGCMTALVEAFGHHVIDVRE